ncbi:hypothetical protein P7K49_002275 [Saguinus oedipus]|uniref:Uncharacterized protein n=1 Tax=Saguinus oedipus TaxID=9490 RepID=A0ABQ9WGY3_SAGOE|nr:hypothetical protein P7K49_002275 [Saguinus oedipus]
MEDRGAHHPDSAVSTEEQPEQSRLKRMHCEEVPSEKAHTAGVDSLSSEEVPAAGVDGLSGEEVSAAGVDALSGEEVPAADVDSLSGEEVPAAGVDGLSGEEVAAAGVDGLSGEEVPAGGVDGLSGEEVPAAGVDGLSGEEVPAAGVDGLSGEEVQDKGFVVSAAAPCLSQRPAELAPSEDPIFLRTLQHTCSQLLPPPTQCSPTTLCPPLAPSLTPSPGRIPIQNLQRHTPRLLPLEKVTNWTDCCHPGPPETPPGILELVTALMVGGGGCSHGPAAPHTASALFRKHSEATCFPAGSSLHDAIDTSLNTKPPSLLPPKSPHTLSARLPVASWPRVAAIAQGLTPHLKCKGSGRCPKHVHFVYQFTSFFSNKGKASQRLPCKHLFNILRLITNNHFKIKKNFFIYV